MKWALAAAFVLSAHEACAETLVTSLSNDRVGITSNYTGSQLAVFGAVLRDARTVSRPSAYDVVITVRGPPESILVREKRPLGPIWINRAQKKFAGAPSFLGVYASRPVADITTAELSRRFGVGLQALVAAPAFALDLFPTDPPFRTALLRLKKSERLYLERDDSIHFLSPDVFRGTIGVPATAPPGAYRVETALFSDSVLLDKQTTHFQLVKAGFEQQAADLARDNGTLYGIAVAAMSLGFGWFASIIFRRD